LERIEESAPDTKVKIVTPKSMITMQKIYSYTFAALISPYPTVATVDMIK